MEQDIILKVQSVQNIQRPGLLPALTSPKLFVEIEVGTDNLGPFFQSRKIRGIGGEWKLGERFLVPADRTDKTLQFSVKATSLLFGYTTVGIAQCMISDIALDTTLELKLFKSKGRSKARPEGIIVIVLNTNRSCEGGEEENLDAIIPSDSITQPRIDSTISTDTETTQTTSDTLNVVVKVYRLTSLLWKSRFPGLDNPALYIEILREGYGTPVRTKSIRDSTWDEELTIPGMKEGETLRFRLNVVMPLISDRTIGEAQLEVACRSHSYQIVALALHSGATKVSIFVGQIELEIYQISHNDAIPRWKSLSKKALVDGDIKNQLQPHTLPGKIWSMLGNLDSLHGIISAMDQVAKLNSYLDLAWKICSSVFKVIQKQHAEDQKVADLVDRINDMFYFVEHSQEIKVDKPYVENILAELLNQTAECALFICQYFQSSFGGRLVGQLLNSSLRKIDEFHDNLAQLKEDICSHLQIQDLIVSSRVQADISKLVEFQVLGCLKPVDMNAALKPFCLSGTCEDMLQVISDWIVDIDGIESNVFWLHGLAGSGKSTIATTIAKQYRAIPSQRLGAFLFFERGKNVQESFVRTVASQLANSDPILRSEISASITSYGEGIVQSSIDDQFEHLIGIPLQRADKILNGPTLIVIDALDEYGDEFSRRPLLSLISSKFARLPPRFRIFVTSRPETDIVAKLSTNRNVKSVSLDAGEDTIPAICLYLTSEMSSIHQNKQMRSNWPSDSDLYRLSVMSEGLFVWASTLSRLLHTSANPKKRLDKILSSDGTTCHRGLDTLYENVLSTQLDWDDEQDTQQFREVVGVALFCMVPLSDASIDQLLGWPEEDSCSTLFHQLRSVFDFFPGCPIRPLHASFRDYLTDEQRSSGKPWSLIGFDAHYHITQCCLSIMFRQLRFNIGVFESYYSENDDPPGLEQRIATNISLGLQYASVYWVKHLLRVNRSAFSDDLERLLDSFLRKKFLLWAEVLCLIGEIKDLRSEFNEIHRVPLSNSTQLLKLFNDACYFFRRKHVTGHSVRHLYISQSILSHPSSLIDKAGAQNILSEVDVPLSNYRVTNLCAPSDALPILSISCQHDGVEVLLGSSYELYFVARKIGYDGITKDERLIPIFRQRNQYEKEFIRVSHDLRRIALVSPDVIEVWNADHGWIHAATESTISNYGSVVLHPVDANILAYFCGGIDQSIHVINIAKQSEPLTIPTETTTCQHLTWSDDGSNLAFSSDVYGETLVWSIDLEKQTANKRAVLDSNADIVLFRPSTAMASQILLVDYFSTTLYDVKSGEPIRDYGGGDIPCYHGTVATFSHDGSLLAKFFHGGMGITLFEVDTGHEYVANISLPRPISKVEFTPDGKQLVVVCGSHVLQGKDNSSWESNLGEEIYTVSIQHGSYPLDGTHFDWVNKQGQSLDITSALFSPDETKFLTSSSEGTIHVRSAVDCMLLREHSSLDHTVPVEKAVWSVDGITIYYSSKGVLYSSSNGVLCDAAQLGSSSRSRIAAIQPYRRGSSEHIALSLYSYGNHSESEIVVVSTEGALIRGPFSIKLGVIDAEHMVSVSCDGLLVYHQQNDSIGLLNLETSEPAKELAECFSTSAGLGGRLVFFPGGSRIIIMKNDMRLTEDSSQDFWGWPEEDSDIVTPSGRSKRLKPVHECTIWDVNTKRIIQSLDLSEPKPQLRYEPSEIAVSPDDDMIVFTGQRHNTLGHLDGSVSLQVWTCTGDIYTCSGEVTVNKVARKHCIDITRDRRLLIASNQGIVIMDLASTLAEGKNRSILATRHYSGNSLHASTIPPGWVYKYENYSSESSILDENGNQLLILPKEIMDRLDPPGSTHVIRRNRLKIDAPRLLAMQNWVEFFKPSSDSRGHEVAI